MLLTDILLMYRRMNSGPAAVDMANSSSTDNEFIFHNPADRQDWFILIYHNGGKVNTPVHNRPA